jgi:polyisoprenoid-binding protein YceI
VAVADREHVRYRIEGRHSRIGFSCAFMKFLTVHGHFNDFSGWVEIDNDDPKTARAECVVKTASVDTGSLDRDYHLCSKDFFAVESYPDMVFQSTGVERRGDERFRLIGDLTIRNTTRPIRLDVRLEERETDSSGNERATLTASTVISRLDWFLDWQEALEAGRWIVGEQIKLDLEIALVHRPEGPAG